jgi:hypothetical protein
VLENEIMDNAKCLAACWNAFEGVPQPPMSNWPQGGNVTSIVAHREKLREERAELPWGLVVALDWIDAVSSNTELPTMPGFDHDRVNDILAKYKEAE